MKSCELKDTKENLLNTFLNDSIGRDADVIRFEKILNAIDDSCSISLLTLVIILDGENTHGTKARK